MERKRDFAVPGFDPREGGDLVDLDGDYEWVCGSAGMGCEYESEYEFLLKGLGRGGDCGVGG